MKTRVLFLDPHPDERELYRLGLSRCGLDVVMGRTENDLTRVPDLSPAVIVVHLQVPESDGLYICERLRDSAATAQVPVVLLTAAVRPDRANRERAQAQPNCAAFVGKPCTPDDLAGVIQRVASGERGITIISGRQQT